MKQLARKYKDFPIFRSPQVFLTYLTQSLPILLLSTFFGAAAAGFYSIGKTVLGLPSQLIGKAVGDVFYPRITEASNKNEKLAPLIKKATLGLSVAGIVPFGLVVLFGPWLFGLVFGQEWTTAGEYARWIALWSYFGFMNRPSVVSLPVLKAQSFHLAFEVVSIVVRTGMLAIGYLVFESDVISVALFSVSGVVLNSFLIGITYKLSLNFDRQRFED